MQLHRLKAGPVGNRPIAHPMIAGCALEFAALTLPVAAE